VTGGLCFHTEMKLRTVADYARFPEDRSGHRYPWPLV